MIDDGQIRGAVGPNVTCVLSYEFRDGTTYTNNIWRAVSQAAKFHIFVRRKIRKETRSSSTLGPLSSIERKPVIWRRKRDCRTFLYIYTSSKQSAGFFFPTSDRALVPTEIENIPRPCGDALPCLIRDLELALNDDLHLVISVLIDQRFSFLKAV